jgi:hypothetical protein
VKFTSGYIFYPPSIHRQTPRQTHR